MPNNARIGAETCGNCGKPIALDVDGRSWIHIWWPGRPSEPPKGPRMCILRATPARPAPQRFRVGYR